MMTVGLGGAAGQAGFRAGAGTAGTNGFFVQGGNDRGNPGAGGGGAGMGGAVFDHGGVLTLTDSTLTANIAAGGAGANNGQGLGGAVFVLNGAPVTIVNSTLYADSADVAGALEVVGYDSDTSTDPAGVTVQNSILAGSPGGVSDLISTLPSPVSQGQPNIDAAHVTVNAHDIIVNPFGAAAQLSGSPLRVSPGLGAPVFGGGSGMQVLLLEAGSPALAAGDPSVAPSTDERGVLRPASGPTDIGAVQSSGVRGPAITITAPRSGAGFAQHASVRAAYACVPVAGELLASCHGTVANGAALDTLADGLHTLTVTATDGDGHRATGTVTYTVGPSSASLRSLLRRLLARIAHSRRLLDHGKLTLAVKIPTGGRLRVVLSLPGKRKPRAVAGGQVAFKHAGTTKLTIKLTGRKLLHRRSIKLEATGSYLPTGAGIVKLTALLKLRR